MNGILLIDKPAGVTSAEVVRRVKRSLPRSAKVGHLGTLDPFATGLLPLCIGEATKIAQFLNTADKAYEGLIQLGAATDTGDCTGAVTEQEPIPLADAGSLAAAANSFLGDIQQVPPMYSALKCDGVPLYRLARRGIAVERAARPVRIDALTLEMEGGDRIRFTVTCSKGTYIRVLAEDIGRRIGTRAHLATLRRTAFGGFRLGQAVALDGWDPAASAGWVGILPALAHLPVVRVDADTAQAARQGKVTALDALRALTADGAVLVDPLGSVAAVAVSSNGSWRYGRVLAEGPALHATTTMLATDG